MFSAPMTVEAVAMLVPELPRAPDVAHTSSQVVQLSIYAPDASSDCIWTDCVHVVLAGLIISFS